MVEEPKDLVVGRWKLKRTEEPEAEGQKLRKAVEPEDSLNSLPGMLYNSYSLKLRNTPPVRVAEDRYLGVSTSRLP